MKVFLSIFFSVFLAVYFSWVFAFVTVSSAIPLTITHYCANHDQKAEICLTTFNMITPNVQDLN